MMRYTRISGVLLLVIGILFIVTGLFDAVKVHNLREEYITNYGTLSTRYAYRDVRIWEPMGYPYRLIIFGALVIPAGLFLVTRRRSPLKTCPYCAESIKKAAIVCRYCGKEIPVGNSGKPD